MGRIRIVASISYCCTFPLVEFALLGTDEVDGDFDVLANELLAQEFTSFLSVGLLLRIGLSNKLWSGTRAGTRSKTHTLVL